MAHRENIELNTCPILFIIGNGFDLGLGMKTRYEDVYDGYIHTSPKSQAIEAFKAELSKRKPYDKWSDFEMGMAEYARTVSTEDEFIACIRDCLITLCTGIQQFRNGFLSVIQNRYSKIAFGEGASSDICIPVSEINREIPDRFSPGTNGCVHARTSFIEHLC